MKDHCGSFQSKQLIFTVKFQLSGFIEESELSAKADVDPVAGVVLAIDVGGRVGVVVGLTVPVRIR